MQLRSDVKVEATEAGTELTDLLTGLTFQVEAPIDWSTPVTDGAEPWVTLSSLGLLEEGLSEDDVRQRQSAFKRRLVRGARVSRVQELLAFARSQVPYYRERAATYDPAKIEDEASLDRLPLMSKAELRGNFPDRIVAEGLDVAALLESGALELAATSGTTGERLQVFADMELDSVPGNYEELWALTPSEEIPTTAVFTTPTCLGSQCHLGRAPFEERLRGGGSTLYLNSLDDLFSMPRSLVEQVAGELARFKPDFLLVNPVYLHWLIRRAREFDIALHRPRLVLSCYQYLSKLQRRAIEAGLGAPIYGYYFATDLSGCRIGIECPRGRLHVREDHTLVEVVGPEGRKAEGALGTLALTALANRVMPLVRYIIGDVGRLTDERCDCAVAEWQTLELHGRLKDVLQFGARTVTTREVDEVVAEVAAIDFYKLSQTGTAEVTVEVVPSLEGAFDPAMLEARLTAAFALERVRVKVVRRLDPEASLKFRLTQSHLSPPELL